MISSVTAPPAVASVVGLAPEVKIVSMRVPGSDLKGRGAAFQAGLDWAIDDGR